MSLISNHSLIGSSVLGVKLEPEVEATVARMNVQPSQADLIHYNDLIISIKNGQGLELEANNLSSLFNVLYINASHDKQTQQLNWARESVDKTEVGNTLFTQYVGVKSDGASYNALNLTLATANQRIVVGSYLVDDVDNSNHALGGDDGSRGVRITFSDNNFCRPGRDANLTSITAIGNKRHLTVTRTSQGPVNSPVEQWVNGVLSDSDMDGGFIGGSQYELCRRNGGAGPSNFFQNNIAFTYYTNQGQTINIAAMHESLKDYLINKGITGL